MNYQKQKSEGVGGYKEDYTYPCYARSHNTEMSVVTRTLSMNTIFKENI